MKRVHIFLALILMLALGLSGCSLEDKHVSIVKNGHFTNYPSVTIGTAFEKFFANPQWKHFKSDKGEEVVEFTGKCQYHDVEVMAKMQFLFSGDNSFEAKFLSFNDVPQNMLMMAGLISKVFEKANEQPTQNTAKTDTSKIKAVSTEDLVILGIPSTATKTEIINKLGTPKSEGVLKKSMNAEYFIAYEGVKFDLTSRTNNGRIVNAFITQEDVKTLRGIGVGDPESKIVERYGTSYKLVKNSDGNAYKYIWGKANSDDMHGLVFQCNNGRVTRITIFP